MIIVITVIIFIVIAICRIWYLFFILAMLVYSFSNWVAFLNPTIFMQIMMETPKLILIQWILWPYFRQKVYFSLYVSLNAVGSNEGACLFPLDSDTLKAGSVLWFYNLLSPYLFLFYFITTVNELIRGKHSQYHCAKPAFKCCSALIFLLFSVVANCL